MFYQAKRSRRLAICRGTPMLLCTLLLISACSSGSAKAGLSANENLAPSIVSLDLQVAQRVHGTDEAAVIRAKGRQSDGGQVNLPTDWEPLDGGTVTPLGDGSIALFSSDEKGPKRVVGRGRGNGNGNGNGGGGSTPEPTAPIVDTITVVVEEPSSPIQSVSISPQAAVVVRNTSQVFTVSGVRADGTPATPVVTWSASGGGTIVDEGAGMEFNAGTSVGEWSIQAVAEGGAAATAQVQVTDAWLMEDFSRYDNTSELMGNGYGVFSNAENINTSRISLDTQGGFGGSPHSMRYDFPDRSNDSNKCSNYSISRMARLPEKILPGQEVWIEVAAKFSANFSTLADGCAGVNNPGYKFIFLMTYPDNRFELDNGYHSAGESWSLNYPGQLQYTDSKGSFSLPQGSHHDGQWHTYRMYAKLPSAPGVADGEFVVWIDGVKAREYHQVPMWSFNGGQITSIYGVALGRNTNQGPTRAQSVWWGRVAAWRTNPGW